MYIESVVIAELLSSRVIVINPYIGLIKRPRVVRNSSQQNLLDI
jgi:hypothetical protein